MGDAIDQGEKFGTIESVKAVEDLNAPVSGTVIEINSALLDAPEQIGDDPYGEGWLLKVRMDNDIDLDDTLTSDEYREQVEGE